MAEVRKNSKKVKYDITEEIETKVVKENKKDALSDKIWVRLDDEEYEVEEISLLPVQIDDDFPEYLLHLGGFTRGEWVYAVTLDGVWGEEGGIYEAEIVLESISPITFVIN